VGFDIGFMRWGATPLILVGFDIGFMRRAVNRTTLIVQGSNRLCQKNINKIIQMFSKMQQKCQNMI